MFYKKSRAKVGGKYKWFPRACVNKHTVYTQDLGEAISRRWTVTPADVHAVIRSLPEVMSFFMENGNSVHLDGLGSFYYKLSCAGNGVDTPEEVSSEHVLAIRVQFIPERRKKCGKYCRALGEGVELVKLGD